jgi:hypothetical protein
MQISPRLLAGAALLTGTGFVAAWGSDRVTITTGQDHHNQPDA